MANRSKAKGTRWETDVLTYLRDMGLDTEPLRQLGNDDEGDLVVRTQRHGLRILFEAKNEKAIRLPAYLRQAVAEANLFASRRQLHSTEDDQTRDVYPVAVVKARNQHTREGYCVMRLEDFGDLIARQL